jgi:hypothetical protein
MVAVYWFHHVLPQNSCLVKATEPTKTRLYPLPHRSWSLWGRCVWGRIKEGKPFFPLLLTMARCWFWKITSWSFIFWKRNCVFTTLIVLSGLIEGQVWPPKRCTCISASFQDDNVILIMCWHNPGMLVILGHFVALKPFHFLGTVLYLDFPGLISI